MADQSNKINGFKSELEKIKSQLRRPDLEPRIKQIYYSRGKELEKIIADNDLVRSPQSTVPGQAPSSWGTDQPEEEDEEEPEYDEETGERLDNEGNVEEDEEAPKDKAESAKKELADQEVKSLGDTTFDENTKAGQEAKEKAAADAARAKSGQPVNPNEAATAAPGATPSAKPEVPGENVPGGAAIGNKAAPNGISPATSPTAATAKTEKSAASDKPSGNQSLADRMKGAGAQLQNNAKAAMKNAADNMKKKLSKEALKALMKSPIFWEIVGGIVLVILIVGVAYALFASFWRTGDSGQSGATYTQPVDPVKDKDWLAKLLKYAGDNEVSAITSKETIDVTRKALIDIQSDVTLSDTLRGKATTALNDLSIYENSAAAQKKAAGEKVIADIKSITDDYYACRVIYTPSTSSYFYVSSKDAPALQKTDKLGTDYGMPAFALNPRLCGLLIAMSDPNTGIKIDSAKYPMMKVSFRGSHSVNVAGKDDVSSHYCGQGVDISPGANTGLSQKELGDKIREWIWANEATLKAASIFPEETFGPGPDYSKNINAFGHYPQNVAGHEDHTHIGFGGCRIKK
ncbi:MAG: hypothetical protein WCI57_03030 [Candidatus Berkelbacteria bacterium]